MNHFEAIDRVILPATELAVSIESFVRLGWRGIAPPDYLGGAGEVAGSRSFYFGGGARAQRLFHLEVAAPAPQHQLGAIIRQAAEEKRGLCAVVLRVKKLAALLDELGRRGVPHTSLKNSDVTGEPPGPIVRLAVEDAAGMPLFVQEHALSPEEQTAEVVAEDGLNHKLAVRRLDHLAAVASNLDAQTHFWTHLLGIPLFGEVVTPVMVIRQFKIGDAILELLGPATPESPIHQRAPGLISMMSLEVADLNAAVAQAKSAGFTISDPAKGALPGTIIATIPATQTSGLTVQLLQYV
jgi:catechol 2,3-dioxygenase-like lactoylglutathione lyase family enzyme